MVTPLFTSETKWECPNCTTTAVTRRADVHTEFHTCPGMKGLTAPMVPAGTKCKVEAHEREDFIGDEIVALDGDGRPVMNLITTRDDGQDCTVYAPTATASAQSLT
jgi:hypothetical protein